MACSRKKKDSTKRKYKNQHKFLHKEEITAAAATCHDNGDMISELPDDILASIISRLPLSDAVSTSILSTRWRHLSAYRTRLNFSPSMKQQPNSDEEAFSKYADMVDRTLGSHKGGRFLEEFRIHDLPCYRGSSPCAHVERWLGFALSKQVQTIDLHMNDEHSYVYFPLSSFMPDNSETLIGFKSVKELSLRGFDVDDQDLELLLKKFVLLERLSIEHSSALTEVSIYDELAPNLRFLNVSSCSSVESVEIKGLKNLVSLRLLELTPTYALVLKNVPKLVELSTYDNSGYSIDQIFSKGITSKQLVKLSLSTDPTHVMIYDLDFFLPKMGNLKQVEVEANMYNGCSHHQLIHMIEACPYLQKLDIKFVWWGCAIEDREVCRHSLEMKPNQHLKRVKLSGFIGCPSELGLSSQLIAKAVALEELIVEISSSETRKIRRRARARVWQHIRPLLRDSVHFAII